MIKKLHDMRSNSFEGKEIKILICGLEIQLEWPLETNPMFFQILQEPESAIKENEPHES